MPIKYKSHGYDPFVEFTVDELTKMYLKEGLLPEVAREKAVIINREITRLNVEELRFWKKVRENEIFIEDLHPSKRNTITGYDEDDDFE